MASMFMKRAAVRLPNRTGQWFLLKQPVASVILQRLPTTIALGLGLASRVDELPAVDSGLAKTLATHNAIEAVQAALQLTSNHGLARRNPLERHLRDVLCGRVHTPQDDSAHVAAGRRALGL